MKIIDARKLTCPQPVIMTKKEADMGTAEITTIVDNETAKLNVLKLGAKLGFTCSTEEKQDGIYVKMVKGEETEKVQKESQETAISKQNKGYVFGTNILGSGSDELGSVLMKGFIYTITETNPYPDFMIFLNSGVKLTAEGSASVDDIKKLEDAGVKVVSCGTCLDYYSLKEKLAVGQVTNMYDIVETITNSDNATFIN